MPIRVDTRDNLRPKRPAANKLPLRRHEVTPEDRASNVEASSSEESEEDIDNVLARLGKKCEIADPMERFVKWYNGGLFLDGAESQEVSKHCSSHLMHQTPVTGASVGALGSTQRAKRRPDEALVELSANTKRTRPTHVAVGSQVIARHLSGVASTPADPKRPTIVEGPHARGKRTAPRLPPAKTTTSPTSAAARPTLHVKTASPATKRLAAVKQAASRPPPTTAKSTETEAHPKKKPTAGKRKVPPALKPAPARTRIFYARRAKETSESALAPGRLPS
ncbi:unnamed protein product [Cutaneotrichosporon oleaginosum]